MYDFSYENSGSNSFLVQTLAQNDYIDKTCQGMLSSNEIEGIASVIFTQIDDSRYFKYNITSKIPMAQYFSRSIRKSQLIGTFAGICDSILVADEYMLPLKALLFDSNYIYVDIKSGKITMICIPLENLTDSFDLKEFFKKELLEASHDTTEDGNYVIKILNYLKTAPQLSVAAFREYLFSIQREDSTVGTSRKSEDGSGHISHLPGVGFSRDASSEAHNAIEHDHNHAAEQQNSVLQRDSVQKSADDIAQNAGCAGNVVQKMSLIYLLNHYSAENLAIYKAQRANRATDKQSNSSKPIKTRKNHEKINSLGSEKSQKNGDARDFKFAIPGKEHETNSMSNVVISSKRHTNQSLKDENHGSLDGQRSYSVRTNKDYVPSDEPKASFVFSSNDPLVRPNHSASPHAWNDDDEYVFPTIDSDPTALMDAVGLPYLLRISTQERIYITKPEFRIGRGKQYPDYSISDNFAVTHSHAIIIKRGDDYYIKDTNSRNHTFLNGESVPIPPNVEFKLENNMAVQFANERFKFIRN